MHSELQSQLYTAVRSENLEALRAALQEYRSHPEHVWHDLGTALCLAARYGAETIVRELLKNKADVLFSDCDEQRPIHHACFGDSLEVLRMIVRAGSPLGSTDRTRATALYYAVEQQKRDLVAFLVKEGAGVARTSLRQTGETPLHRAASLGDELIVRLLVKRCINPNPVTFDKTTPLMEAVKNRNAGAVLALCEGRADTEKHNNRGETALHLAMDSTPTIVRTLLDHGANASSLNTTNKQTPLHLIAFKKPTASVPAAATAVIAGLLIDAGANVSARDRNGYTPLHSAALSGNSAVAEILLDRGASVDPAESLTGDSPLITATLNGRNDVIKLLIGRGSDVNFSNKELMSPLHTLQGTNNPEKCAVLELLLQRGARVNKTSLRGYTPLDRCVFRSVIGSFSVQSLVRLVRAGAVLRPNETQSVHNSPLCWLTWHSHLSAAQFLVQCGWELGRESWLDLPGKTPEMADFLEDICQRRARRTWSLSELCRATVRQQLNLASADTDIVPLIEALPIPKALRRFLDLEGEVAGFVGEAGRD